MLKEKYDRIRAKEVKFETYNMKKPYKVLIVSYGTMARVCKTTIDMLKANGLDVALLRPKTLFPFPEKKIREAAKKAHCKMVLSIEMSMGQMVEDVERSVQGACPVQWYGKCGGEIPPPKELAEMIKGLRL